MKKYLAGEVTDLLFYCPPNKRSETDLSDDLQTRLAAAETRLNTLAARPIRRATQAQALGRRVIALQGRLAAASITREQMRDELRRTRETLAACELSQRALEDCTTHLRRQVGILEGRLTDMQSELDRSALRTQRQLDRSDAERDKFRMRAHQAETCLADTSAGLNPG
ncbi:hypothetical protein PHYPSEUDO_009319 [Phytophthora pseudosyringae]|uniref:Uncharacterized protein n=1 Tax=Phytophthora pseudosyringae TaxID=221518 RepID=A0A8T1VHJ5_9STRA|nr:hypothetical protein PHYPSEUDO_009319 [Phytophthora pseudosyringae]